MGTWNSTIFGDDVACGVRDEFLDLMSNGVSAAEATKALEGSWGASLSDPDDGPIFWLALAATQWKYACLVPEVQAHAIRVIDSGEGLARWEGRAADARRRALSDLRSTILSPQPAARRPRKRKAMVVPSTKVPSPDERALATAYELAGVPRPGVPRMQVLIEMDSPHGRGGGGVFVADCEFGAVSLAWKDPDTLQIVYPHDAKVFDRKPSLSFCGRRIQVEYRAGAV